MDGIGEFVWRYSVEAGDVVVVVGDLCIYVQPSSFVCTVLSVLICPAGTPLFSVPFSSANAFQAETHHYQCSTQFGSEPPRMFLSCRYSIDVVVVEL